MCEIEILYFFLKAIFFTNVVFPAPEGDDKITITPLRSGEGYIPRNKRLNYIIKKYALYIRKIIPKSIMDELSEWYFKVNLKNTEEIVLSQEFLANLAEYYNKDIEKVEKLLGKKLGYKINI